MVAWLAQSQNIYYISIGYFFTVFTTQWSSFEDRDEILKYFTLFSRSRRHNDVHAVLGISPTSNPARFSGHRVVRTTVIFNIIKRRRDNTMTCCIRDINRTHIKYATTRYHLIVRNRWSCSIIVMAVRSVHRIIVIILLSLL